MREWIVTGALVVAGAAWLAFCFNSGWEKQEDMALMRLEGRP